MTNSIVQIMVTHNLYRNLINIVIVQIEANKPNPNNRVYLRFWEHISWRNRRWKSAPSPSSPTAVSWSTETTKKNTQKFAQAKNKTLIQKSEKKTDFAKKKRKEKMMMIRRGQTRGDLVLEGADVRAGGAESPQSVPAPRRLDLQHHRATRAELHFFFSRNSSSS